MTEIRPFESRNIGDLRQEAHLAEAFLVQEVPRPQFSTVCTSDTLHRWPLGQSGRYGSLRYSSSRRSGLSMFSAMNTHIWGCHKRLQNAVCGTFLDVNHFLEIVTSSNLLLRHPNTSVDVVEGLKEARRYKSRNKLISGRPGNHDFSSKSRFLARFWT